MRRTCSILLVVILFSSTLTGCTGIQEDVERASDEEASIDLVTPNLILTSVLRTLDGNDVGLRDA